MSMNNMLSLGVALAEDTFGSPVHRRLWSVSHLSTVQALELKDARFVVVKCRPYHDRLRTCHEIHLHVWKSGYPCAEPLGALQVVDGTAVTFETLLPDGEALDAGPPDSPSSAKAFARLVALSSETSVARASLEPPMPWIWWDHTEPGLWPIPDDMDLNLNNVSGPSFVDQAAARLQNRLKSYSASAAFIGHGDWEAQNVFWRDGGLHAVHDWDSLVCRPEAFLVGPAAAVHGVRWRHSGRPRPEHMLDFIDTYASVRQLEAWSEDDRKASVGAGLWVHFFNAKKAVASGSGDVSDDPYLHMLHGLIDYVDG